MKFKSVVLTGTALLVGFSTLKAQEEKKDTIKFLDRISIGVNVGSNLTYTDLKQYDFGLATKYHSELGWGASIFAGVQLNSIFTIQGQVLYGTINGTHRLSTGTSYKKHSKTHNQYFTGNLWEPNFNLNVNLTNLLFNPKKVARKIYVYGYAGIGITSFRSVRYNLAADDVTKDVVLGYEGYNNPNVQDKANKVNRTNEVVLPLGLGAKYRITPNISVTLETSFRYMKSDKLDAFQAGTANDIYSYSSAGVVYNFSSKMNEPESKPVVEELEKVAELVDGFGDKDGDGTPDRYDKDQNTPAGVKVYADGTAVDSDGDGVPDYLDKEKFSNAGAKVDENGVESDADGDKVPDSKDLEANTPAGSLVDVSGRAIKLTPSGITGGGGSSYNATSLPSIYFAVNSSTLDYKAYDALTTIAKAMKSNPNLKLVVVGHCDAQGSADFNQKLGLRRAEAVVAYLVKVYGIDKSRLSADTKGSSDLLTKQKNSLADRRVDIMTK